MKLSWRDIITSLLVIGGGAIVWAKYYSYSWAMVGSWRSATAIIALGGVLLFAFTNFDFNNFSIANVIEMILGGAGLVLAVWGMTVVSHAVFYSLAATLGVTWLIDIARHVRHTAVEGGTQGSSTTHAAPVH